jgi:hypothetical protein
MEGYFWLSCCSSLQDFLLASKPVYPAGRAAVEERVDVGSRSSAAGEEKE